MGANSSPPASDAVVAAAAAALKTKKRKTSDAPLPIGLSFTSSDNGASGAASPAGTPTEHDAESLHTQATLERMATALDLSHSLVDRALLDPTLPKSTSLTMEDSRSRLEQLSAFMDALRAADVDGVARQLQLMFVSDVGVLSTLRDAASRSVDDANKANNTVELLTRTRRISSASAPPAPTNADTTKTNETNKTTESPRDPNTGPSVEADGDVNMEAREQGGVRDSLHENEAAQALTGLRLSSTASPAVAASAAAAVAAVAAAGGSLPSPRGPVSTNGLPPMASMAMAMGTSTATSAAAAAPPPPQMVSTAPPPAPTPTVSTSAARDRAPVHTSVPYHISAPAAPLPSLSPTHALSIFAPQPSPDGGLSAYGPAGLFVTAPHHNGSAGSTGLTPHGLVHSPLGCGTPGSLPSLFARGLLAPISTPYDPTKNDFLGFVTSPMVMTPSGTTPLGTPMLTPHSQSGLGPFVDWKSLAPPSMGNTPSNNQHADASAAMAAAMAAAAVAEAAAEAQQYQQQQQQTQQTQQTQQIQQNHHTPVTALYRPSAGQSPVKRKSITSKQMAESAAAPGPDHGATLAMPIAKSLAALERTHPARKANPRRWTKEEDDALRQAVENHKEKNWKAIAAQVPGRNHTQCLQRWTKVLAPGLVKGHWSPHEDELLKRLVAGGNKNWGEVAAKIPGRTSKQCRERWHNHLDPNIVRGAYSPEEDRIILEAQARLGNRWSVIAAMLPGRTEDAVKIRWKSHCRLWKARKYLRKPGGDEELGPDPEMGGEPEDDSSDDDGDEGEAGGDMGEQKQTPVMAA